VYFALPQIQIPLAEPEADRFIRLIQGFCISARPVKNLKIFFDRIMLDKEAGFSDLPKKTPFYKVKRRRFSDAPLTTRY
jgi:hypothetical protein